MDWFPTAQLAERTKALYSSSLNRWIDCWLHEGQDPLYYLNYILDNPRKAMAALRKAEHIKNTHQNHAQFISAACAIILHERRDLNHAKLDDWRELMENNRRPERERKLEGRPTKLQEDKQIEWAEVLRVRDELPLGDTKLLLAMYTYLNPVRADYYNCPMLLESDVEALESHPMMNCFVVSDDNPRVILTDYKTQPNHGTLTLPVPRELYEIVLQCTGEDERSHLFLNDKGEIHTRQSFSNWASRKLTNAFGRPMTLTAIRHSFCSQLDFNRPIKELNEVAHSMGHSVGTQRLYKWEGKNEVVVPKKTDAP